MLQSRPTQGSRPTPSTDFIMKDDVGMTSFYEVMGEFYKSDFKKHASPTRRLMNMKESTWKHKQHMYDNLQKNKNYSLTYCISPDKAYIVEPHGGEIDYDQADKNLEKFYDKVMNQDITQHKVRESKELKEQQKRREVEAREQGKSSPRRRKIPLALTTKVTKRKIGRILTAVSTAVFRILR